MDTRFMQINNLVLTREVIINSMFLVDHLRELNFHCETTVGIVLGFVSLCYALFYLIFWADHNSHSKIESFLKFYHHFLFFFFLAFIDT